MSKIKSEYGDLDKYNFYGDIYYYKKGTSIYHNPYGPAVMCLEGNTYYYLNGKLHRLDGPAVICSDGEEQYWINDTELTKEKF